MTKQLLTSQWLSRIETYNKVVVGYSGGLDSTVLLHVLSTMPVLRSKLLAVHINHQLSPNAKAWEQHCDAFCDGLGVAFEVVSIDFDRSANIEERARDARYQAFSQLLSPSDCLLLAHHQDDQAETLLLQLVRGAGIDGLAAMAELCQINQSALFRPLLSFSRKQLEEYANLHQLSWIEDESNEDTKYSRNFLRQEIFPLLEKKWPAVANSMARAALHCQQAKHNLEDLAYIDCPQLLESNETLNTESLTKLPFDRIINVLRQWLRMNKVQLPGSNTLQRIVTEMIDAREDATPEVSFDDVVVRRYQSCLYLDKDKNLSLPNSLIWSDFPEALRVSELGELVAITSKKGLKVPNGAIIEVKFRAGGELFSWHGQTKSLKKLLQVWGVPPWLRDRVPLVFVDDELAVVVGYAVSDLFYCQDGEDVWELVLQHGPRL